MIVTIIYSRQEVEIGRGYKMSSFFRFDTDEERRVLLARARKALLLALQEYELEWESIRFIQLSDTITYKLETSTADNYLLRIHSDRLSKAEISSELLWLQALNRTEGLHVPEAIASCEGNDVIEVAIETEIDCWRPYITIMRWVDGEHATGEFTNNHAYHIGALIGRLHAAAEAFSPSPEFVRPAWGVESFRRELAKLECYYERFLSEEGWKLYQAAAEKIVAQLTNIQPNKHNYGLIHADLHTGNMVFKDNQPFPIDFGRCGYGYFLYDLASSLLELSPDHRQILLQGYESVKRLERNHIQYLEGFFIMCMIQNYCHHVSNPAEIAGLIEEQPYAQAYLRAYLADRTFLLQGIEK